MIVCADYDSSFNSSSSAHPFIALRQNEAATDFRCDRNFHPQHHLRLVPPYLIGIAIDVVVNEENSLIAQLGFTSITGQLAVLSALTLLIWSLESLTEYAYSRLWRNLAQTLQHELRVDAYSHLQELELSYFEDRSSGMLLSVLNDDINQLERF
ncbi:MAG: ABC transporter transmembrane domain-containing protein [Thainema sp.]